MFTGLVKELGVITQIQNNTEGRLFYIFSTVVIDDLKVGDSVSVNGVCLTVVQKIKDIFSVQAVATTLEKSSLGRLKVGEKINLELAMRLSDRLGGHLVQGHVNGLGQLLKMEKKGQNYNLWVRVPAFLQKYMIKEGSIAIDGISLTIAHLGESYIGVTIIPHTWQNTNLCYKKIKDFVNIEVDMMAKYAERLMSHHAVKTRTLPRLPEVDQ